MNDQNLKHFKKGYDPRRHLNGRPRKLKSLLAKQGYTLSEVTDCINLLLGFTLEELKAVWGNPNATALELTIAAANKKSIEKGSLYSLEILLNRVYGKPAESIDITSAGEKIITAVQINHVYPEKKEE